MVEPLTRSTDLSGSELSVWEERTPMYIPHAALIPPFASQHARFNLLPVQLVTLKERERERDVDRKPGPL